MPEFLTRRQILISTALLSIPIIPTRAVSQSENRVNEIIKGLAPRAGQILSDGAGGGRQVPVGRTKPVGGKRIKAVRRQRLIVRDQVMYIDLDRSLDFEIYFKYDSARITPQASKELQYIGRALQGPELDEFSYLIAGHTDSKGSASYNEVLSLRRAEAVKKYLLEEFALHPDRLVAHGYGERLLKTPDRPTASVNRRVQFALIVE